MNEMTMQILEETLGKTVLIRLKGGKSLRGRLKGFDQHLNLVLEETERTTNTEAEAKKLGVIIVRGDNVILISPPPR